MANRLRTLDPQASPAAMLGAELRGLRLSRGLSLAALGRLVHVSGDLVGKIEKADRRPQLDLLTRLDVALEADGRLCTLGADLHGDDVIPPDPADDVALSPDTARLLLRRMVDTVRADDHAMNDRAEPAGLLAHARAAERIHGQIGKAERPLLRTAIAEAYQLAGWMSFDHGRPARAENLLGTSRRWVERAADPALAAFVLGPNLSFVATYGGNAALGVERAYGAIGWARRSGNRRLSAFAMAIGARAHARLGEAVLCLDLLDQAEGELDRHTADDDGSWLSVFDRPALDGHRGSCLLDLGQPDRALGPLAEQDVAAPERFVRNRVIWQLDRIEALFRLHETDQACTELLAAATARPATMTPRVVRRFRALELHLHALAKRAPVTDAIDRIQALTAAHA